MTPSLSSSTPGVHRRDFIGLDEVPDASAAVTTHALHVVKRRRDAGLPTCGDDCPEHRKFEALVEEVGEVARELHEDGARARLRAELLDVAVAATLWAWAIGEEIA